MLQCVAVRCSVLQFVATIPRIQSQHRHQLLSRPTPKKIHTQKKQVEKILAAAAVSYTTDTDTRTTTHTPRPTRTHTSTYTLTPTPTPRPAHPTSAADIALSIATHAAPTSPHPPSSRATVTPRPRSAAPPPQTKQLGTPRLECVAFGAGTRARTLSDLGVGKTSPSTHTHTHKRHSTLTHTHTHTRTHARTMAEHLSQSRARSTHTTHTPTHTHTLTPRSARFKPMLKSQFGGGVANEEGGVEGGGREREREIM